METLCRICGSPGSYDIFGKIPRFLNTDRRDLWQQPLCKMVSDVTGIPVSSPFVRVYKKDITSLTYQLLTTQISKNDGLPERICSLCISYLKHAVLFRNRAVETRLSLLSAAFVTMKSPLEDFGIVRDNEENEGAKTTSTTPKEAARAPSLAEFKSPEVVLSTTTSRKLQRFFDYEEKSFVEDDMTKLDGMEGIEINHPEVFRERKCGFCLKKFMLEDTYDDHLDECLFRTLIEFVKDSNYIVRLKDEIAISNHEFIRRMVFAIQRVNKAIRGMQLPAAATLIDEPSVDLSSRPTGTPSGKPQQEIPTTMAPKVLHFFQQSQMQPSTPPLTVFQYSRNSSHLTKSIPHHPGPRNREGKPFQSSFIANRSPHSFTANRRTMSGGSSSHGSTVQTPSPTNSNGSRKVVCKFCDKTFLTISHLDGHMIREHT